MIKKYFQKITLFTLLAFLCFVILIIIIISRNLEGVKSDILYHLSIALVTLVAIDLLLKQILKLKTAWLWILQVLLLLIAVYTWIVFGE